MEDYNSSLKGKQRQIQDDPEIKLAVSAKVKLLALAVPSIIIKGEHCEYVYNNTVNELLNKWDEIITHRINAIMKEVEDGRL